jgi:hypothetical protein
MANVPDDDFIRRHRVEDEVWGAPEDGPADVGTIGLLGAERETPQARDDAIDFERDAIRAEGFRWAM